MKINLEASEIRKPWGTISDIMEMQPASRLMLLVVGAQLREHGPAALIKVKPVMLRLYCFSQVEILMLPKRKRVALEEGWDASEKGLQKLLASKKE